MAIHQEIAFEAAIEHALTGRGWAIGDKKAYDIARGLDPTQLLAFVKATQPNAWQKLVQLRGDEATAEAKALDRVASEIDKRGTLDVLRHGLKEQGISFRLAYFKPAHGITPELQERYDANRLTVVRQLRYEATSGNELDLALFVNGIPVATAELKNPATLQTVKDAMHQYRVDRDPKALLFARRALVHFAVDPDLGHLTTRLAGEDTRFLPFNRGSDDMGAGNPPNPDGYRTDYLWERVWERDAWMDILARFIQVERTEVMVGGKKRTTETVIFPRYHQWDCVRKLEEAAREEGPGQTYLVEHSAGSGKSNTIAWIAHRLSTLHDVHDHKVFDQVIVITDRVVLDRQLQDTIYQFEHVHGVVRKIDESSAQLADALATGEARIIVTTLQKFPVILDRAGDLGDRRYAIIVDEAHSSQTGEAAKALKQVLGSGVDEAAQLAVDDDDPAAESATDPDELMLSLAARGRQPNLSYFAFTATPKPRTLEIFGRKGSDGNHHPFHLYSMRQAIEEEFILDVLRYHTSYSTFYKLSKLLEDDPQVAKAQAAAAIAKYVSLHPSNIAQRVQIVVEHFRQSVATKIGGRAKAMVVTRSRLHAVKYKQAIDRYVETQGYDDLRALVAFSGTVTDEHGFDHTEAQMNGFGEKELPDRFASDDFRILVVAEKYQTGYDQPLLHTMYVDKKLEGVRAVQTLSRLNRIHPGKDETFVLDFENDAETIRKGFEPFYVETLAAPTDPNVLFDAEDMLREADVIRDDDVDAFVAVLLKPAAALSPDDQAKLYSATDPAVERWKALSADEREAFRGALKRYLHAYSFLSQIVPVLGPAQEKLYLYGRFLATRTRRDRDPGIDISDHVALTHLRIQHSGTGDITLGEGAEPGVALPGGGAGPDGDPPVGFLSEVVQAMNERFGIDFTRADALFIEQVVEEAAGDDDLAQQARANTLDNFRFGFNQAFENLVLDRHASNAELIERLADQRVYDAIRDLAMREVYGRLREAG